MPLSRGSCGHVKAAWDNHASCITCAGCDLDHRCQFCLDWPMETWTAWTDRRTWKDRKRSGQSRKNSSGRDFSPHDLDHMASGDAMHRSLPGNDTGHILTGPFIGHPVTYQLLGPVTSPVTGYRSPGNIDRWSYPVRSYPVR